MSRVGPIAPDFEMPNGFDARGNHQLRQLGKRIGVRPTTRPDRDQQRAFRSTSRWAFDLEDGQDSDSAVRLTGLAGTTVEMACL